MSHWYILSGGAVVRYTQLKKDGSERKNIIRGVALADGAFESVTTILKQVGDSGGLVRWAARQGVLAGFNVGISAAPGGCAEGECINMAMDEANSRMQKASEQGTAMHNAIEARLARGETSNSKIEQVAQDAVEEWALQNASPKRFTEVRVAYDGPLAFLGRVRFGGTCDLLTPYQVIDFKTVEPDGKGVVRDPKPTEAAQLAGYRQAAFSMGMTEEKADCINVYLSRLTGEIVGIKRWSEAMCQRGLELLAHAYAVGTLFDKFEASIKRSRNNGKG